MRSRSPCNASVGLMPGLWKGARKMPKRRRWLMGTFLRFYDGAFAGLLIRINLALDPPFPDRGLDRHDNRSLQRCHLPEKVTKVAERPRRCVHVRVRGIFFTRARSAF